MKRRQRQHDGLYFNFPVALQDELCITVRDVSEVLPTTLVKNKVGSTPFLKSHSTKKLNIISFVIGGFIASVHFISILLSIVTQIDVCELQTD